MLIPVLVFAFAAAAFSVQVEALAALSVSTLTSSLNIHNCSGTVPPAPDGYSTYFSRYGPQIEGDHGWESWTIHFPVIGDDYKAMTIMQWTRGDPTSSSSDPNKIGTFVVSIVSDLYENITASVTDKLVYHTLDDSHLSISVGDNRLSFNGSLGTWGGGGWNVSVNLDGLKIECFVDPSVLKNHHYHFSHILY
jgi:hypothetical protein